MSAPLRITERSVGGVVFLHLDGHLVFDEGDRILRERVVSLVDAGARALLVDLHDVTYIDSGGIGALVEMYLYVTRHDGRFVLVRPSHCADRVLHITHLSTTFQIFEEEAAAVRSLSAPA
jgi:anti-sigma B factor antagonist